VRHAVWHLVCARLGGEEFLVLVHGLDIKLATRLAERILSQIRAIQHPSSAKVTTSIGIAEISAQDQNLFQLVDRADQALYEAKRQGRDCVRSAPLAAAPASA
jgi:diguanylate cyclase (GGDEF)-like protein